MGSSRSDAAPGDETAAAACAAAFDQGGEELALTRLDSPLRPLDLQAAGTGE